MIPDKLLRLVNLLKYKTSLDVSFFCVRLLRGYGVDLVVANQAKYLALWGHNITIYTLTKDDFVEKSLAKFGNIKIKLVSPSQLGSLPQQVVCDVAIAETDPFFDLVLKLNPYITKIAWDYGEPYPEFFPEQMEMRKAQKEARTNNHHLYHKTIAISEFVKRDMSLTNAGVVYCGCDHLISQHPQFYQFKELIKNRAIKEGYAPEIFNQPFLLCVSRLGEIYRNYKGTRDLPQLASLTNLPIMLVGKSDTDQDVEFFKNQGLICLDNLSNEELISAYLNCTAVVSLSRWEGYNLPLVEAMVLGKMAFALDCGAHRETGAKVAPSIEDLAQLIINNLPLKDNYKPPQTLYSWKDNAKQLNSIIYEARLQHLSTLLGDNSKKVVPYIINRVTLPRIRNIQRKNQSNLYLSNQKTIDLSVLILSKDRVDLLKPCLESIEATFSDINYEIIIGDTGSENQETETFYYSMPHQVLYLGKYNFSCGNNDLAERARGKYLLLLNNDTESVVPDIKEIIKMFENNQDTIGAIGTKLLYPDFKIQHSGVVICNQEPYKYVPEHIYKFSKSSEEKVNQSRILPGVTGACLFTPKDIFIKLGGLDTIYQEECQDIDYCFRLKKELGLSSYYHAGSTWIHKEGQTRSVKEESNDRDIFINRWREFIDENFFGCR